MKFKTLAQFKAHNKATDRHFFDHNALKFFNSRIESGLLRGEYFITSEQFNSDSPRKYSVRHANDDGSVSTIPDFQAFNTFEDAKAYVKGIK